VQNLLVQCVTNGLQRKGVWMITKRGTLEKTCIHVLSVRNVFHLGEACICIWIFTEVNTSAQYVANVVNVVATWQHTDEVIQERNRFACPVCSKRFTRAGSLVKHSRIHSGEKPYKCHVCGKAFSQSGNLNTHMRVHTGDNPNKCSLCNKCFSRSSSLQQHKRYVHSNIRPYHCPYCGKLFKTNVELKRHVRIHTDAKSYSCRHCSQCFRWLDRLKAHLLKSHSEGTWFTCDICQKQFAIRGELKQHSNRRHEGVKPCLQWMSKAFL